MRPPSRSLLLASSEITKSIDKYFDGKKKGETIQSILDFCKDYSIKLIMYNINGDVIASNYPKKKNDKKTCVFMAYNNHVYSFDNKTLEKVTIPKENIKTYESLNNEFDDLLKIKRK